MSTQAPGTNTPSTATPSAAPATTPTLRTRSRRALFWIVIAVVALATATIAVIINSSASAAGPALGADNPAPAGGMAVAHVLTSQGVHLVTADSAAEARKAVGTGDDATLLVYDENGYLDADHLRRLDGIAATTVLIRPNFQALRTLAPAIEAAGSPLHPDAALRANCTVAAAVKAGRISAPQATYRLDNSSYTGCFPTSKGEDSKDTFAMAAYDDGASELYAVGSTSVFDNEHVILEGNAALALNLLGEHKTLVWYLPTLADVSSSGPPSLGELTPGWVTPIMLLLIVAVIAAAVWRGRRFGPLVIENLPVIVRAEETMEGRARLYQRSSARGHAIDALRIGAIGRIATRCGLPTTAHATEVVDAASALLGTDPYAVRGILLDAPVHSDADLMRLSAQLDELERAVAAATGAS